MLELEINLMDKIIYLLINQHKIPHYNREIIVETECINKIVKLAIKYNNIAQKNIFIDSPELIINILINNILIGSIGDIGFNDMLLFARITSLIVDNNDKFPIEALVLKSRYIPIMITLEDIRVQSATAQLTEMLLSTPEDFDSN